jgi:hypothetical protein
LPWGEVKQVLGLVRLVLASKDYRKSGADLRERLGSSEVSLASTEGSRADWLSDLA